MHLDQFLRTNGLTRAQFAERIGVGRLAVQRWATGHAKPRWQTIAKIEAATDGAVTAADFMPSAPDAAA